MKKKQVKTELKNCSVAYDNLVQDCKLLEEMFEEKGRIIEELKRRNANQRATIQDQRAVIEYYENKTVQEAVERVECS